MHQKQKEITVPVPHVCAGEKYVCINKKKTQQRSGCLINADYVWLLLLLVAIAVELRYLVRNKWFIEGKLCGILMFWALLVALLKDNESTA